MEKISRRNFLVNAAATASSLALSGTMASRLTAATGGAMSSFFLAIGTSIAGERSGIHMFRVDEDSAALTTMGFTPCERPSFTLNSADGKILYAVGETASFNGAKGGSVAAYTVSGNGALTLINAVSSGGAGPCHLCLHSSRKFIIASNYSGGSAGVIPIAADGSLLPPSCIVAQTGKGPNPKRQSAPHMHSATELPGGIIAIVDLGLDKIFLYTLTDDGKLIAHSQPFAESAPGAGPRWLAVHPDGKFVYAVNELDCTVTAYTYENQTLTAMQTLSTIAETATPDMSGASIRMSSDGRFLYASTRAHDSIVTYAVSADGMLTFRGTVPSGGLWPRDFALSPNGKLLIAANQKSDAIAILRVNASSGELTATGITAPVAGTTSILFFARS